MRLVRFPVIVGLFSFLPEAIFSFSPVVHRQKPISISNHFRKPWSSEKTKLTTRLHSTNKSWSPKSNPYIALNEFFKSPVPESIKEKVAIRDDDRETKSDIVSLFTAPPCDPGMPRPLWLVILASVPTGLVWYGYYKFCIEEELLHMEILAGKPPRGFGGYGTLGPFTYGLILGPIAEILHLPGGINWSTLGIIYIYYTQFLLYDRVNELYRREGRYDPPLTVWWTWPIFFPFNLIVGLRQVHFLSQYLYRRRGIMDPPKDPVAQFFPFIAADVFTWQEFLTKPKLWCVFLENANDVNVKELPEFAQKFLSIGTDAEKS